MSSLFKDCSFFYILFLAQILMNTFCCCFTCAHCQDNGSCSGNCITTGINALFGGSASILGSNDTFSLIDLKTFGCGGDQRVRGSTQGHNNGIAVDYELRSRNLYRTTSSGSIRLTQFHLDTFHTFYPVILINDDLYRISQKVKDRIIPSSFA